MDAETLAHATEPFFTTKGVGKGTGLGLSMVQGMVEQCGGQLRLESKPGEGTRAEVWLPAAERPPSRSSRQPAGDPSATRALTVLAVDDDCAGAHQHARHARGSRPHRLSAYSGEQALAQLERASPSTW